MQVQGSISALNLYLLGVEDFHAHPEEYGDLLYFLPHFVGPQENQEKSILMEARYPIEEDFLLTYPSAEDDLETDLEYFLSFHLPKLLPYYKKQNSMTLFMFISIEEYLEAISRLTQRQKEEFMDFMFSNSIRVDIIAVKRQLDKPIGRITFSFAPFEFIKIRTDSACKWIGEVKYAYGAAVFTNDKGEVVLRKTRVFWAIEDEKHAELATL